MERPLTVRSAEDASEELFYNYYPLPVEIVQKKLSISLEREGPALLYQRECAGEAVNKTILSGAGRLLLNPVEPVNKPREITQFFLVELERSLTVGPREQNEVMVTFPVEIAAIYMPDDQAFTILDIFSLAKPKYTLYGNPRNGLICRYWKSRIYTAIPSPNPLLEGVMGINIRNTTSRWIELTKAVFSAQDMHIFYNRDVVFAAAYLKINSETTAETGFDNIPLHKGMEKSLELFASRKNIVTASRLIMEEGL